MHKLFKRIDNSIYPFVFYSILIFVLKRMGIDLYKDPMPLSGITNFSIWYLGIAYFIFVISSYPPKNRN